MYTKKFIKRIILTAIAWLNLFLVPTYAENVNINSYYPSPYGSYDAFQLYPQPPFSLTSSCKPGTLKVMSGQAGDLYICQSDSSWSNFSNGGIWSKLGNQIYLTNQTSPIQKRIAIGVQTAPAPAPTTLTFPFKLTLDYNIANNIDGAIIAESNDPSNTELPKFSTYNSLGSKFIWHPHYSIFTAGEISDGLTLWDNPNNLNENTVNFGKDNLVKLKSSSILSGEGNKIYDSTAFLAPLTGWQIIAGGFQNIIDANSTDAEIISRGSIIIGGQNNSIIKSLNSVIGGGRLNQIQTSKYSVVGGGAEINPPSAINNLISQSDLSIVGGGILNSIMSTSTPPSSHMGILGGRDNKILNAPYSFILGGETNIIRNGNGSTIAGGQLNSIIGEYNVIIGGSNNQAGCSEAVDPSCTTKSVADLSEFTLSTVGGGYENRAHGQYANVGGGYQNTAYANSSIVGGNNNTAKKGSFIGAGANNNASGEKSVVVGGQNNIATEDYAFITGGSFNKAVGKYSVILNGHDNTITGNNSWAGGTNLKITSANTFVWGFKTPTTFDTSDAGKLQINSPNSFIIATGQVGINTPTPKSLVEVNGNMRIETGTLILTTSSILSGPLPGTNMEINAAGLIGLDIAEHFPSIEPIEAGDVLTLTQNKDFIEVRKSSSPYDSKAIGIASNSAAAVFDNGQLIFSPQMMENKDNSLPVALTGQVMCKISLENGPIQPGDLLTSSSTIGHAMKATDENKSFGTIIAKAMEPFDGGINKETTGLIKVLVLKR